MHCLYMLGRKIFLGQAVLIFEMKRMPFLGAERGVLPFVK
ncbi:hypothetical protein BD749_2522 [Pontibacter ramchanderi]|uniref:Uncharacterized protein n=1 Tax=Pontibacter ramchanderi TaxID=1179743 RepID=A0A2N3UDB8_9BACT|nr:hypothetical protein BD749_2522 [Pontibacter ramchanderi]